MKDDQRVKKRNRFINGKMKDLLIIAGLALLLVFSVWRIFYSPKEVSISSLQRGTDTERMLSSLLSEIDGVGEVRVMVYEDENGVKSVVVVCDGASNIRVNANIREAAAAAVGTDEKNVKIYLKKD